ncbi:MAG: hypothetical protein ACHQII_04200, partial [Bacteroidia bacterium]
MNKKNILLVSIAILFLSACNSSKNGIAMKRKYNNGYYVSVKQKNHNTTKQEIVSNNKKGEATATKVLQPVGQKMHTESTPPVLYASLKNSNGFNEKKKTQQASSNKEHQADLVSKIVNATNPKAETSSKKHTTEQTTSKAAGNSDAMLVIMIILCLFPFFNLIAVYLK